LVTIGGFDRYDLTCRVVDALTVVARDAVIHAVVGHSYANGETLDLLLGRCGPESRLLRQLPNLGEALTAADLCVCGGGMTKDESAYMGVPTIVISQTDDEDRETKEFARCGLAVDFGLGYVLTDEQLRERLAAVIADRPLRERLRRTAWARFPADPMLAVARAIAGLIAARI
jgi:spore coat polysaccharide biosynthesis predicted glycosyltransferase SpsG